MTALNLPLDGSCRCGRVKLRITKPPMITMACHCTGCQKMSSSAYSLSAAIPTEGFEVTEGEPVIGGLVMRSLTRPQRQLPSRGRLRAVMMSS